ETRRSAVPAAGLGELPEQSGRRSRSEPVLSLRSPEAAFPRAAQSRSKCRPKSSPAPHPPRGILPHLREPTFPDAGSKEGGKALDLAQPYDLFQCRVHGRRVRLRS